MTVATLPRSVLSAAALVLAGSSLTAQTALPTASHRVRTLTDTLSGAVGGIAVDRIGFIYVADFRDTVWKITPDGRAAVHATGLYGPSGNAIDSRGNLLQSNFAGNSISRIDRHGNVAGFAEGLRGPVGIALTPGDTAYVCNCSSNDLSRVLPDGTVQPFAASPLFRCPNGITRGPDGHFYVVNFNNGDMLKVTPTGRVSRFALLPGGGNGHITVAGGALYATSLQGQQIHRITLDGAVTTIAGTGRVGERDGPGDSATFTFPNGIAAGPTGDRLYVNDFINRYPPTIEVPPEPRFTVRQIKLASLGDIARTALAAGGIDAMIEAYNPWKRANPTLFTQIEINQLGYQLMGSGQLPGAIELFELNVASYPQSANVYDSLGEAYMNAGQKAQAILNYEKSLQLNPANTNATEMLKRLRGDSTTSFTPLIRPASHSPD